jgi:hypothetical protein
MSRVVPLRPVPKKDRTAAKRARRYRKRQRASGRVASMAPIVPPTVTPTVTESVTPTVTVERPPVDLIALRRDIEEWTGLHQKIERLKVSERRNHISWQVSRFGFLLVGFAFFVLLALAALS